MPIEFDCPACETLLRTPDRKAGQSVRCPACGESIWVPYDTPPESVEFTASMQRAESIQRAESGPWRNDLPSERFRDLDNPSELSANSISDEAEQEATSVNSCSHCGSPRSTTDSQCRTCGAGFQDAATPPPVIPRDIADIFHCAWEMFSQNAGLCIFASLIDLMVMLMGALVVLTPAVMMLFVAQNNPALGVPAFFVLIGLGAVLVYASVTLGHAQFYFKLASGERPDMFSILHVAPYLRPMLVATLIYFTCVSIGVALFVLPGLLLAALWGMYPFVLVHKNVGAIEALGEAWRLSSGNWGIVVAMALLSFFVLQLANTIPGAFLLVLPFTALLQTYLYLHLSHARPSSRR